MFLNISHFIGGAGDSSLLLSLAIIVCALFLEDITTIIVGVLAADGTIGVPLAFVSIYVGIALGDAALYGLGAFARTHPRLAHYIDHDFTAPFRSWLEKSYRFKVFSGHFVPGLRFTTFVASGFFRLPLSTYIPSVIAGGLLLETVLFSLSYVFGSVTSTWVGPARWGIAGAFVVVLFFIGRHNLLAYRAQKDSLSSVGGTRGQSGE